jgi:hypothetical protein
MEFLRKELQNEALRLTPVPGGSDCHRDPESGTILRLTRPMPIILDFAHFVSLIAQRVMSCAKIFSRELQCYCAGFRIFVKGCQGNRDPAFWEGKRNPPDPAYF